jgi:hypothetical protein
MSVVPNPERPILEGSSPHDSSIRFAQAFERADIPSKSAGRLQRVRSGRPSGRSSDFFLIDKLTCSHEETSPRAADLSLFRSQATAESLASRLTSGAAPPVAINFIGRIHGHSSSH